MRVFTYRRSASCATCIVDMGGGEAAFLLEARLERDFRELQRFNDIITTWRRATGHVESQTPAHWPIGEELKRASRKVGGFWSR